MSNNHVGVKVLRALLGSIGAVAGVPGQAH